jgi:hypothetical protein
MRETADTAATRGGYTRRMFKADRASMRSWAKQWRHWRFKPGGTADSEDPFEALRMACYFRDKSIEGSRAPRPVLKQMALL